MLDDLEGLSIVAVNMAEYAKSPQNCYITRLLVLLNDMDSIAFLNELLKQEIGSYDRILQQKWGDGVRLYLLRQNGAVMLDALREVITVMAQKVRDCGKPPKNKKKFVVLWHLIASDADLKAGLDKLEAITSSDRFADTYDGICILRDKLASHVDLPVLTRASRSIAENPDNEIAVALKYSPTSSFRALFADHILSVAWQAEAMNSPAISAASGNKTSDYVKYIVSLREDIACFAYVLTDRYVEHFKLHPTDEMYGRLRFEINEEDKKLGANVNEISALRV